MDEKNSLDIENPTTLDQDHRDDYTTPVAKKRRLPTPSKLVIISAVIIVLLFIAAVVAISSSREPSSPENEEPASITVNTQSLDAGTLNEVTGQLGPGPTKQQLTISPDTLFKNNVSIDKNLTVSGQGSIQGSATIGQDLTVATELKVGNNTSIGGNLSVNGQISAGSLNVGVITLTSLKLDGDLQISGHIITNGATPTTRLGLASSSGNVVINGNDINGTITITTGSSPLSSGEMAVVTFRSKFTKVPRVQLTPVSVGASKLDYFVARSSEFFSIEATSQPAPGERYSFDYFISE